MAKSWRFVSEEAETISLHDHCITSVEEDGPDLILHFTDDGFDVTKDNSLNPTGRHRNTGPAAIVLKSWQFLDGAFDRGVEVNCPDGTRYPLPEKPLTQEQLLSGAFEAEVLDFDRDLKTGTFRLYGDGGVYYEGSEIPDGPAGFIVLELYAQRVLFCWNELPRDAWFQDWPRK